MTYIKGVYPRIDAVIASVVTQDDWDVATSPDAAYLYQLRAAQNMGFFEPFSPEQTALNDYLAARHAGLKLCDYAWRLYAHAQED